MTAHPDEAAAGTGGGHQVRWRVADADDGFRAMAFALVGAAGVGARILDAGCVTKSYPGFFGMLRSAGASVRPTAPAESKAAG